MTIKLNPNTAVADDVRKKLIENNGYCPCSIVKNPNTKCMCKEFRDMVKRGETGECHCGLYIAEKEIKE